MAKILIVNDNMEIGGIQKSLINFLKYESSSYDISLLLFSKSGALLDRVPQNVNILTPSCRYSVLGLTREQLKRKPFLFILKSFHIFICKLFGKRFSLRLMGIFQKKYTSYDVVISYSHLTNDKSFSNCCGEFVLDKTISKNKICLIHCDYLHSNTCSEKNNKIYKEFDKIACCSESVKSIFVKCSGVRSDNVYVLRNHFDFDIINLAKDKKTILDATYINILIVARLSLEKGIDIAISALSRSSRKEIRLIVLGDGPELYSLKGLTCEYGVTDRVLFLGAKDNPYAYMASSDYLLVPSRHEAAPIVFDEARILGLTVISSNTTSAIELLDKEDIIYYSIDELVNIFERIKKQGKKKSPYNNNSLQQHQFLDLVKPQS